MIMRPISVSEGGCMGREVWMGLGQGPKGVDFADIVCQGEPRTPPLYIHF